MPEQDFAAARACAQAWLDIGSDWQSAWDGEPGARYRQIMARALWREGLMSRDRDLIEAAIRRVHASALDWPAHLVLWIYRREARCLQSVISQAPSAFRAAHADHAALGKSLTILDPVSDFRISVLVPTYNRVKQLEKLVQAMLAQTHTDWEMWIVDDGSSDGTQAFCQALSAADPRVHSLHKPANKGLADSLQLLYDLAPTPLLTAVADDDLLLPDCLEQTVALYRRYPWLAMAGGGYWYIRVRPGGSLMVKQCGPYYALPRVADTRLEMQRCGMINPIFGGGALLRKEILAEVSRADPTLGSLTYTSWDWLISARCLSDYEVGMSPAIVAAYLDHQKGPHLTHASDWGGPFIELFSRLQDDYAGFFGPGSFPAELTAYFLDQVAGPFITASFRSALQKQTDPADLAQRLSALRPGWEGYRRLRTAPHTSPHANDAPCLLSEATMTGLTGGEVPGLAQGQVPPQLQKLIMAAL